MEFCPICIVRKSIDLGAESDESSSEKTAEPASADTAQRFGHYQLLRGEDGKPVELGRGAMGVTYKAFDVDLHCPVTLKVISERYAGDESARLRFLREAVRRRAFATQMLPLCYISAEPEAVTSTRWSSWREKPLSISSDARERSR